MKLSEALQEKKKKILSVWIARTLDSYSSSGFFKQSRDQIANPIGSNIRDGLTKVLELLLSDSKPADYTSSLDQVIRIRAIQDFSPSQAVVPFLELKWVIRQVLSKDKNFTSLLQDLAELDCEIDQMALAAFDIYTQCREQLYQVRIKELKSGSYILTDTPCVSSQLRKRQKGPVKPN
ncbi:MAG: RsbRD N-terminal domain-containing protein [Desulfobulbales bacterium]